MVQQNQVSGVKLSPRSDECLCEGCIMGKKPFKSVDHKQSAKKLELVHSVAQAVGVVSKFCAQSTNAHLTAVKRVLCYLSSTRDLAPRYQKSNEPPTGYSDSDWAGDHNHTSTSTAQIGKG